MTKTFKRDTFFKRITELDGFDETNVLAGGTVDTAPNADQDTSLFVIVQSGTAYRQLAGVAEIENVLVYVHYRGRSKTPLYEAMDRIKEKLQEPPTKVGEEASIAGIEWTNTSYDLTDDHYNTIYRYMTFRVARRIS